MAADWIGWETWEEAAVRKAPATWIANPDVVPGSAKPSSEQRFAYLTSFNIEKPVERALLFTTGEDTVWAWVNGEQVMTANAYPPYHHLPWKKFVRADVTAQLVRDRTQSRSSVCTISTSTARSKRKDAPPMMATLLLFYKDGTTATKVSDGTWKRRYFTPPIVTWHWDLLSATRWVRGPLRKLAEERL